LLPTVTALHPERRDRVRVELDGAPWRTLPAAAVVSAGLRVGVGLDRARARELARGRRRAEVLAAAATMLSRRDRSSDGLVAALRRRGLPKGETRTAVEHLGRLGYVDDARFAHSRAASMAARGYGDSAIRFELEREGVGRELVAQALADLEPELERARSAAGGEAPTAKLLRRLAAKGFGEETIEAFRPTDSAHGEGG
jgi:SOS response regulatory protein OraA/RecX